VQVFSTIHVTKNKVRTFAEYCRDGIYGIGNLTLDGIGIQGVDTIVTSIPVEDRAKKRIRYNIRNAYFLEPALVTKRTTNPQFHVPSNLDQVSILQRTCVWCCQKSHGLNSAAHSRQGYKTTMCCLACDSVSLCTTKRLNGESCFDLWHKAETLYNPCSCEAVSPLVRQHSNRKAPPTRRRNEEEEPNQRSLAAVVTITRPRRSDRQTNTPTNLFPAI
jgi:hypothetical protein